MTDPDWARLDAAWAPARAAGVLGPVDLEDLRAHAAGFVPAACGVLDGASCLDLGTGAGVPGLLLALLFPRSRWRLVDASERRCRLARRAIRAMALEDRVEVLHRRAEDVGHDDGFRESADLAVARLLGQPAETVELLIPLLRPEGVGVVSVDAAGSEWTGIEGRHELSATRRAEPVGVFLEIRRRGPVPDNWPRRPPARRRAPLF